MVFSTSQPSIFGIITSRMIRAMSLSEKNTSMACSPSAASTTSKSRIFRKSDSSFRILSSSSTTKTFSLSILIYSFYAWPPGQISISYRPYCTVSL